MDVSKITEWKWGEMGASDFEGTLFYVTDAKIPAIALMTGQYEPPVIVQDEATTRHVCAALNAFSKQMVRQ